MALKNSAIEVELREVDLNDMPAEALKVSEHATVPILVLADGTVMDESWDILKWALNQNDPDNWLGRDNEFLLDAEILIETNDHSFKHDLDHYKYADRFPEHSQQFYRKACEEFIAELEEMLAHHPFLLSDQLTLADIGVFPYIRQFAMVDKDWFDSSSYNHVKKWLNTLIESELFQHVFQKHDLWHPGDSPIYI